MTQTTTQTFLLTYLFDFESFLSGQKVINEELSQLNLVQMITYLEEELSQVEAIGDDQVTAEYREVLAELRELDEPAYAKLKAEVLDLEPVSES